MDRDYGAEIDELREQLQALAQRIGGIPAATEAQAKGRVVKMPDMHPDPAIMAVLDQLEDSCNAHQDSGRLTYMGVFSLGGRQSTWIRNDVSANHLLSLVEDRTAERVLACIGSRDRLNLLLAILKKPRTVAQLVAECGYHSTGQVYHHLRPLIAADLVTEASGVEKGCYAIQPHRVQGIILLLAGIGDMVNPEFSRGQWENPPEEPRPQ